MPSAIDDLAGRGFGAFVRAALVVDDVGFEAPFGFEEVELAAVDACGFDDFRVDDFGAALRLDDFGAAFGFEDFGAAVGLDAALAAAVGRVAARGIVASGLSRAVGVDFARAGFTFALAGFERDIAKHPVIRWSR